MHKSIAAILILISSATASTACTSFLTDERNTREGPGGSATTSNATTSSATTSSAMTSSTTTGTGVLACAPGSHVCAETCVDDASPASCGASCIPCDAPLNATATCTDGACGFDYPGCSESSDCSGATPVCNQATHECVGCLGEIDCGSMGLACDPATSTCAPACNTANDCPVTLPICNPIAGVCVPGVCSPELGCFGWELGGWAACSGGSCSGGGSQARTVVCIDSGGQPAPDASCAAPKPDDSQSCEDASACFYQWVGTWGPCSSTCGAGAQMRDLTCQRSDGFAVPDAFCPQPEPATVQACTDTSTCAFQWVGTWAECSTQCGDGTQTRTLSCWRASDGATVADIECAGVVKPATSQACTDTSTCTYGWMPSSWGACGTTCGTSVQTRSLYCQRSDGAPVVDSLCQAVAKPLTTQGCNDTSACTYQWVGSFGACSNACGAGTQTKVLTCLRSDGAIVANNLCVTPAPPTTQACNGVSGCAYQWVGAWSPCSNTCGSGNQTRALTCQHVSDGMTVPDSNCQSIPQPSTSQVCLDYTSCTYGWVASGFGACSASCGSGTQTQTVTCKRSDGAPSSDASCTGPKPAVSQACDAGPCPKPTCTLSITPASGGASTTFTGIWASSSNTATFKYSFDGSPYLPAPPTGWMLFFGSNYSVGAHTFQVEVANANGSGTCSASFTISPAPTCTGAVSPLSGTTSTTYDVSWTSSDATNCTWSLDGVDQGSTPCTGTGSLNGSGFSAGSHSVALTATGPGGTGNCSTSFAVGTAGIPVCSFAVTPTSGGYGAGGLNTTFTATWMSSGATSCAWALNGVSQGALPCNGSTTFLGSQYGKGSYSVSLNMVGPGGTNACTTSLSIVDPPTCSVFVTPTSGFPNDPFTATWSSSADATSADAYVDSTLMLSGTCGNGFCTSSTTFTGSAIGLGAHTVYLKPKGPGGTGSCSFSIYIGALGPPICNVTVTPSSGYLNTQFIPTWSASSDATSCSWSLDGVNQGSQTCAGSIPFQGTYTGPGNHTVSLTPNGPGGSGSCQASFQVIGVPTCSANLTSSVASWSSSNATSCTWTMNGANQGPQACSGTQSTNVPSGTTMCLIATNPSGDGTCCSTAP